MVGGHESILLSLLFTTNSVFKPRIEGTADEITMPASCRLALAPGQIAVNGHFPRNENDKIELNGHTWVESSGRWVEGKGSGW